MRLRQIVNLNEQNSISFRTENFSKIFPTNVKIQKLQDSLVSYQMKKISSFRIDDGNSMNFSVDQRDDRRVKTERNKIEALIKLKNGNFPGRCGSVCGERQCFEIIMRTAIVSQQIVSSGT